MCIRDRNIGIHMCSQSWLTCSIPQRITGNCSSNCILLPLHANAQIGWQYYVKWVSWISCMITWAHAVIGSAWEGLCIASGFAIELYMIYSLQQVTPASSKCLQLWTSMPLLGQSISLVSVPVHLTSSSRILPVPWPKKALSLAVEPWNVVYQLH